MSPLFEGIQFGLVLAIMTGPIFFTLLQVGVEEGLGAGIMVGAGIWISDILFILLTTLGLSAMMEAANNENFQLYTGLAGGIILMVFGLATMLNKPAKLDFEAKKPSRYSSWFSLWMKGFLINTVNPFTVLFWVGIASTIIVKNALSVQESSLFFGGIMITIIITDFLKVFLAKRIRKFLEVKHVLWLRRISGAALIAFGVVLIGRVLTLL